ncbi:MAG: hypothetical protein ACRDD7_08900 [Peptostreptococcaceae bacterium]
MKYDYVVMNNNGNEIGFIDSGQHVSVYINGKEWGSPQGDRFLRYLLNDLNKNKYLDEIVDSWHDKVINKADEYLSKSDEFEIGSNKAIQYRAYADGLYTALALLSNEERIYKRKLNIK